MNKSGREKLTKIIESEKGVNWWDADKFETFVHAQLPVTLSVVSLPPIYSKNYNCFVFTFGLEKDLDFLGGKNPVQQEFVKYLINKNILRTKDNFSAGDFIFYKNINGDITHGGIIKDSKRVISKWMWGPIIIHDIWDVPTSFGDTVFFSLPLSPEIIKKEYETYKNSDVVIEHIS